MITAGQGILPMPDTHQPEDGGWIKGRHMCANRMTCHAHSTGQCNRHHEAVNLAAAAALAEGFGPSSTAHRPGATFRPMNPPSDLRVVRAEETRQPRPPPTTTTHTGHAAASSSWQHPAAWTTHTERGQWSRDESQNWQTTAHNVEADSRWPWGSAWQGTDNWATDRCTDDSARQDWNSTATESAQAAVWEAEDHDIGALLASLYLDARPQWECDDCMRMLSTERFVDVSSCLQDTTQLRLCRGCHKRHDRHGTQPDGRRPRTQHAKNKMN